MKSLKLTIKELIAAGTGFVMIAIAWQLNASDISANKRGIANNKSSQDSYEKRQNERLARMINRNRLRHNEIIGRLNALIKKGE